MKSYFLYILLLISTVSFSKFSHEDNLKFLASAKTSNERVDAYLNIIKGSVNKLPDSAIIYIQQLDLLRSSEEVELSKDNLSKLKYYKGVYQYKKGYYLRAIKPIEESLVLAPNDYLKAQKFF